MTPEEITEELKTHGIELARDGADPRDLAECHLGLGIVMLLEDGLTVDELRALVELVIADLRSTHA